MLRRFLAAPSSPLAAAMLCAWISGCNAAPYPAAPPIATYEQAWTEAHKVQEAYSRGYATVGYMPAIMTIPQRPFTAQRTYTEWSQNGSPDAPVLTTEVTIARDREGRIHYESSRSSREINVLISDPVDHFNYRYTIPRRPAANPKAEQCRQPRMRAITSSVASPSLFHNAGFARGPQDQTAPQAPERKDDLGTQDFEGVLAYGQRNLQTVSNQFGVRPMTIENWFSPDLGINLMEMHDIAGQNKYSVTTHDLVFAEPDATLFAPPPNYALPAQIPSCIPVR